MGHQFIRALDDILLTDDIDEVVEELLHDDKRHSLALLADVKRQIERIEEKLAAA